MSLDPLAAEFPDWSDYNYVLGNPARFINPDGRSADDVIIIGNDGTEFNWTPGATYEGDQFIQETVAALNKLTEDESTADFTFRGRRSTGVVFEGNAILDYAKGGKQSSKNVTIEHASKNPWNKGESQHINGTVY